MKYLKMMNILGLFFKWVCESHLFFFLPFALFSSFILYKLAKFSYLKYGFIVILLQIHYSFCHAQLRKLAHAIY